LNLLIAASEAIPYAKTGGLADVTGALPQEFAKLGHDVILLLPRYRALNESGRTFRVIGRLPVQTPQGLSEATIEEDVIPVGTEGQSVRVWAFRQDAFFDRQGFYQEQGQDYPDNLERFSWLGRAVIEAIVYLRRERKWKTDLLHLHDWQTALCAVYLKTTDQRRTEVQGIKSVLTLHNVGYQGLFPGNQLEQTGLPSSFFTPEGLEFYGSVNLLKGGILYADYLTTVSPTYAKEILTPEFGFGIEGVLRNRQNRLQGIINGIDTDRWNPESDSFLPATYSVKDRTGKQVCKRALQQEFSLPEQPVPIFAVIARLTSQKGLDLIEAIIPQLMTMNIQLVILGTGDPKHETKLREFQSRYPNRMGLRIGFDEGLAHRIEGGADIFIMPSRYEPCGLSQLYSLRYGTVPIVRKTGGLADTVVPFNSQSVQSHRPTGFHVESTTAKALFDVVRQAYDSYQNRPLWERLVEAGMRTDVSWGPSAQVYERIFRQLLADGDQEVADESRERRDYGRRSET
jgi:starch synthase